MARNDDSQPSRVYKASDVHKRRVDRKARPDKGPDRPADVQGRGPEPQAAESRGPQSQEPVPEQHVEGVVLTPEFGRHAERQREADDRWFAAMREDVPEMAVAASPELQQRPAEQPTEEIPQIEEPVNGAADSPEPGPGPESAPAPESEPEPASEQPSSRKRPSIASAKQGMSIRRRIAIAAAIVVVAAIAVAVALFTWNRWYRFDDHADMQGEWYVVGTTVPVSIDESAIHLTDDVTYQYEINPQDKTIRYTFGPMEGQGRYWFSDDRQYLVITDGDEFTSTGTAFDDLLRSFGDMADKASGSDVKLPEGEGIIAFSREPDAQALAREREEAAQKAAAEEAARKEAERIAAEQAAAEAAEAAAWEEYYEEEYYEEEPPAEEQPVEEEHQEDQ